MTGRDVITSARWLAREHASELDPFGDAGWLLSLKAGLRRLWHERPEAFHLGRQRVGSMPTPPADLDANIAINDLWEEYLAAAVAIHAVRALHVADELHTNITNDTLTRLEMLLAGPGGGQAR